jgi:predicted amidohydrolase YtcJ
MSYADILIHGGRIFRGLHDGFAEAIAIHGGRVVASGRRAEVEALAGARTRRIDLGGRCAVPAFNDSHQHLLPLGLTMAQVNLRAEEVRSLDALLGRIRAAAQRAPKGAWVLGRGYDHTELDVHRHPTADELQAAAPDNPVFITRACGHVGVANRAALAAAGIDAATPDPEGGAFERQGGALTGLVLERAMRKVRDQIPGPDHAALVDAIERAGRHLNAQGFAAAMDANVGMVAGIAEIDAYRAAHAEGRLPVRAWLCLAGNPEGIADAAWEAGIRPGQGDDMLRFGAMKVFCDGSIGGRTAAVTEPYIGGGTGMFMFPEETFRALIAKYHCQGWQLAIHAIGDAGIGLTLSAMEAADSAEHPVAGRRHRVEHCEFLAPGQTERMVARGIEPVPQAIFMYEFGDNYIAAIGRERAAAGNPLRTWFEQGLHPAAGSDAPVSTTDPFRNIATMMTRRTRHGTILGQSETVSVEQAVHSYSWCGAYTQFAEDRRGRLTPGQIADVAVLSRDIFAATPDEIVDTQADVTLRGGRVVFDRAGEGG